VGEQVREDLLDRVRGVPDGVIVTASERVGWVSRRISHFLRVIRRP
jgi:hypothetical protein